MCAPFARVKLKPLEQLLKTALGALGYELADWEKSNHGTMLRVFIERPLEEESRGITLDDCEAASRQIQRVLEVDGVDYGRLEVSSPGLDRPLKKEADFVRFAGEQARLTLRVPIAGRRNFTGVMRAVAAGKLQLEIEGGVVSIELANIDKARLVPRIEF